MNDRERFLKCMNYEPVDRLPLHLVGAWPDTLARWRNEGLPDGVKDLDAYFGLKSLQVRNVGGNTGLQPKFEQCTISENESERVFIDGYGRKVLDFKNSTTMPEWLEFPVKTREDLRRVLDRHFSPKNLEDRFSPEWDERRRQAKDSGDLILVDGGCYYWTLRSLAGVEQASYLFYDAPDEVDELFERICEVCLEAMRRTSAVVKVDVIGFGEDIGFKTGPLISPDMFRQFILPRYRRVMDFAHSNGVKFAWYDSDGDIRAFIPDYFDCGINILAPCEVAAGQDPCELRKKYGRELRMIGGFDKRIVAKGPEAIDAEFKRLFPVIREGGYLPAIDHSISADISFSNYRHFLKILQEVTVS